MAWSEEMIEKVWQKGKAVQGYDATKDRKDDCTAWMKRDEYGNRNSTLGWEIDHIDPDGSDKLANLRPLQWENNVDKSDGNSDVTWCLKATRTGISSLAYLSGMVFEVEERANHIV